MRKKYKVKTRAKRPDAFRRINYTNLKKPPYFRPLFRELKIGRFFLLVFHGEEEFGVRVCLF